MEIMDNLKPCPFCGEKKLLEIETINHGKENRPFGFTWTANVSCLNCSGSCWTHRFHKNKEDAKMMAIAAWNRRMNNG